ncbi:acyltransferase [Nocardioides sp. L-11A]|uniref:acyltransferase n=1 Tax=Nocardioides sp. L-11A TaxID=3043848 RepID=UPI00249B60CC|nr:acyltransferase [Nocardioides sp. L-11A]
MRNRLIQYLLNEIVGKVPFVALRHHLYALAGVGFGERSVGMLMMHVEISAPHRLSVGANTVVGRRSRLDARGGIRIGSNVNIGSECALQTAKHDVDSPSFADSYGPIEIGDRAWLGERVLVLANVKIGEGAVVAAGGVVTNDIPPFTVAAGVPARVIRARRRDLTYELSYRADFI